MTWDYFVPFSIAALHFWGFGAFAAWRGRKPYVVGGKEAGMDLWIYLVGAGHLFQFYPRYVDFSGASAYANHGRDSPVVLFLSSTGRTHHIQPLEV